MPRLQLSDAELESMRSRLAAAARDLYLDEGESAVTFRRLAERMGLSHTLPYRYFDDKEALLAQARTECIRHFEAFILARDPLDAGPLARVHAIGSAYVGYVTRYPSHYRLIFATEQPPPDRYPPLLAARQRLFDHVMGAVRGCIDAGLVKGDARVMTHIFWITMHGLLTLHVANQLVHGCNLQQLARALMVNLFGPPPPGQRRSRGRAGPARRSTTTRNATRPRHLEE
jgi:AcrR family transcriptional regulator